MCQICFIICRECPFYGLCGIFNILYVFIKNCHFSGKWCRGLKNQIVSMCKIGYNNLQDSKRKRSLKGDEYMAEEELRQDTRTVDQIVDDMSLFDDDLMSMVFDGNIEATELMLKIILKRDDILVESVV